MAFISYAQNFEDVMLARALSDVEMGIYIDIGAQDPEEGSVTKHFYDRGWHGLNFEPSETYHSRLTAGRPRDVSLRCAVGAEAGSVTFYELESTGLSTIVESVTQDFAGAHVEHTVPMTTLDAACAAYGIAMAHFLKIDVEGAEELVLRGTRFEAIRPWIVVVEATRPNSREPHYAHWEPLLTDRGYRFVYADGLNRFYLAEEHADLADRFALPPNYFDGFILAGHARAEANLAHHLAVIDGLGQQIASQQDVLEHQVGRLTEVNRRAEGQHAEIVRLVALLDEASQREKSGLTHHIGLLTEAAARADAQQGEIARLVGLLEDGAQRERDGLAHHVGLLAEAAVRINAQRAEIARLVEIEARHVQEIGEAEARIAHHHRRIGELEAQAERQRRQMASRDDKISWLSQDRDRFRSRYEGVIRSLSWTLTRPLRWGRRQRSGVSPQDRTGLVTEAARPEADGTEAAAVPQVPTIDRPEVPEPARWILTALQGTSRTA